MPSYIYVNYVLQRVVAYFRDTKALHVSTLRMQQTNLSINSTKCSLSYAGPKTLACMCSIGWWCLGRSCSMYQHHSMSKQE